jgi:hypothetical protein
MLKKGAIQTRSFLFDGSKQIPFAGKLNYSFSGNIGCENKGYSLAWSV